MVMKKSADLYKWSNLGGALLLTLLSLVFATSCEDVIEVETDPAPALLVVDAWLNNQSQPQTVRLTTSAPYFSNAFAPNVVGASVTIESSEGKTMTFVDRNDGNYVWTPEKDETMGNIGTTFGLNIEWNGERYVSATTLFPVPSIDSITQEFREDEIFGPDGIYAQFFARDLPGLGNAYWIKTYKNGLFLNKPQELNIAFDAAFDPGAELDNLIFIPPIRELVNRIPDPDTDDDSDVAPWAPADSIRVEIHSISPQAFFFLDVARDQMTNGDNTIFAIPLANTTGNIVSATSEEEVLGMFNVAAVSSMSKQIE